MSEELIYSTSDKEPSIVYEVECCFNCANWKEGKTETEFFLMQEGDCKLRNPETLIINKCFDYSGKMK